MAEVEVVSKCEEERVRWINVLAPLACSLRVFWVKTRHVHEWSKHS